MWVDLRFEKQIYAEKVLAVYQQSGTVPTASISDWTVKILAMSGNIDRLRDYLSLSKVGASPTRISSTTLQFVAGTLLEEGLSVAEIRSIFENQDDPLLNVLLAA